MYNEEINKAMFMGFQTAVNVVHANDNCDYEAMYKAIKDFAKGIKEISHAEAMLAMGMFMKALG